ncbi:hypothetical protein [Pseudomonas sp. GL-B-19]|uniref:hypothetical protein n=1 Tax=Pseudomonas sp. GL-B-19 TaxID=2832393 RepID=UPI001CBC1479|nr:hypothetical protein [Pseudomonas sp. GL-B-19]
MNRQAVELIRPRVMEAVSGTLYVSKLGTDAHGMVPYYENGAVGRQVEFIVKPSYGKSWEYLTTLTIDDLNRALSVHIPKSVFEGDLGLNATATVSYIIKDFGNEMESEKLVFDVKE